VTEAREKRNPRPSQARNQTHKSLLSAARNVVKKIRPSPSRLNIRVSVMKIKEKIQKKEN
jgi:hypothetical protein